MINGEVFFGKSVYYILTRFMFDTLIGPPKFKHPACALNLIYYLFTNF